MAKKLRKKIPWFLIFAVIGLTVGFNWLPKVSEVKADEAAPEVTVGNATPVASATTINSGDPIILNENTFKNVAVGGTVTDNNSCKDLTSVKIAIYKTGTTCAAAGNADNDNCYFYEDTDPANNASCTGNDDTDYVVDKTFAVQYYADPGTWLATVTPADEGAGTAHTSTGVTLNELRSLDVSTAISYGSVAAGSNSTGDKTATVTNTGNMAEDVNISGAATMTCTTRGSIPVGNQEYALATFSYGAGTDLSVTPTAWNLELGTPEHNTVPITDTTYWHVGVPTGTEGTCTGTNAFTSIAAIP